MLVIHAVNQPTLISVHSDLSRPIVTIHRDGRVELGAGVTNTEAARAFWEAFAGVAVPTPNL